MKPVSMSVKDWLIRLTAEEQGHEERTCETVIAWTYNETKKATATNSTIEVSGFGKLQLSKGKTERRLANAERLIRILNTQMAKDITPESRERAETKMASCLKRIEYLKQRLKDAKFEGHMERLEERPISSQRAESTD